MRKSLLTILLAFGCYFAGHAQQPQTNAKSYPLKQVTNMPSNFYLTQLPNGLEVLVIEDHAVPLTTIELVVKNGAFVQTPELAGLAHLYEHMFFKANKDYPNQEAYLNKVNELGIVFNGTTSEERVNYFITLNKSKLQDGLQFMNSAARYPKFLKEEMSKENVVVAGEFQRNESNPIFYLRRDMDKRLWGKEFSRKNTIGEYNVIYNATPEIMQQIKDRYYYPNNSMLVVAGDVEHNDAFGRVDQIYGDWKPSSFNIWEKYPVPEFEPLKYSSTYVTENKNSRIPILMMNWQGPDTRRDLSATYAADVFSYILSENASKLQKALVETGLAYQVNVNYQTLRHTGPITVIMVPNPDKVKEAIGVLNEQINQWTDPSYFTEEQLTTAKEMLEIEDLYSKEKTSDYVHTVSYWWATASLDYYSDYVNNIKKVSRDDIRNYLNKYVAGKPHITGILVSPSMRGQMQLDSFFVAADSIENYKITSTGSDEAALDTRAPSTLSNLAFLLKQNPDKNVVVHIYASKDKVADERLMQVQKMLTSSGIPASRITVDKHIKKDKQLSETEKPLQNTITFSFK